MKNSDKIDELKISKDQNELKFSELVEKINNYSIPEDDKSLLLSIIKKNQELIRIDKLNEVKIVLVKREYISRNTELDKIQKELLSAKKENDLLIKLIAEMRVKVHFFENSLKDKEKLIKENEEKLEFINKSVIKDKLSISKTCSPNFDLIQLILQDTELDSKSKEQIKKLIEEVNKTKSVSIVLNQKTNEQELSSIEEILNQRMEVERKRFEELKSILIKDREQCSEKIIEKENENEGLKIKIKKLENIINDGSHEKEQKVIELQNNCDKLSKTSNLILGQVSSLKIEKQLLEKKLDRYSERFKNMEKQIETLQTNLKTQHQITLELKRKYGEEEDEALLNIRLSSDVNEKSTQLVPSNVINKIIGEEAEPKKANNKP